MKRVDFFFFSGKLVLLQLIVERVPSCLLAWGQCIQVTQSVSVDSKVSGLIIGVFYWVHSRDGIKLPMQDLD